MNKILKILSVLLVIIISLQILTACVSMSDEGEKVNTDGFSYRVVEIEGMTCIWYDDATGYQGYAGLTCNWDEWQQ